MVVFLRAAVKMGIQMAISEIAKEEVMKAYAKIRRTNMKKEEK